MNAKKIYRLLLSVFEMGVCIDVVLGVSGKIHRWVDLWEGFQFSLAALFVAWIFGRMLNECLRKPDL